MEIKEVKILQARLIGESKVKPGIRRLSSIISDIFSTETTNSMWTKLHVEPAWGGGKKVVWGNLGHITKMISGYKTLENLLL